ncbi:alpha/beta hydrolase fold-domain-containing protein [Staphylotrichum tortipilum]|uniref:Alpha/beta hydrolase fold-domain-containing protein n=1 Tax=Staphylotrichum tortipilum TaxID=2831512 RepID=A0AAN6RVJ8_9PEZI|nr:alpha/beta hydrolase fold-domain-containing protein [Staphylotrichum longicolle]
MTAAADVPQGPQPVDQPSGKPAGGPPAAGQQPPEQAKDRSLTVAALERLPLMLRVALFHLLRISKQSRYLDLRTEVTVAVLRSFVDPPRPLSFSSAQKLGAQTPAVKGKFWISTYTCPPPPTGSMGLQDAIAKGIDGLRSERLPAPEYDMPVPAPTDGEWTGHRAGATADTRLPDAPQRSLYDELMREVTSPVTVLYFHGGAYYMLDPATHRPTCRRLAKRTGGRVYSVRYRLAPQYPFPAALMDALMSYLALLYPPEGAFHAPVKPEHIVFAGDSAGGNLSLALLQLLLHLRRVSHTITPPWASPSEGTTPAIIPLPAGVAVNSPWLDITHSSPSCITNAAWDYLPTLARQDAAELKRPACTIWPARPPRRHLFAPDALLPHPLVSLVLAPSWAGAPPVYVCTGWELLADEGRFLARKMVRQGVRVVLEEYEAMPHCFAIVFPGLREGRRCLEGWAGFVKAVVEQGKKGVESRFVKVKAKTVEETVEEPGEGGDEEEEKGVEERVWKALGERGFLEELDGDEVEEGEAEE